MNKPGKFITLEGMDGALYSVRDLCKHYELNSYGQRCKRPTLVIISNG